MKGSKPLFLYKILMTICIFALIACFVIDAVAEPFVVKSVQARGGLNVRKAPCIEADVAYLLEDCATVVVLEKRDGWYRVGYNTPPHCELGWVCGDYLK